MTRWYEIELAPIAEAKPAGAKEPKAKRKGGGKADAARMLSAATAALTGPALQAMKERAAAALEEESKKSDRKARREEESEQKWLSKIMRSGTMADRAAALTVMVQQDPVHRLQSLRSLVATATHKGRREGTMAVDSLKELFISDLLPDRKLRAFQDQPLRAPGVTAQHLALWYFEDQLKELYDQFVQALEVSTHDTVLHYKQHALRCVFDLLVAKPELEHRLLLILLDKLGDPERRVASHAATLVRDLGQAHPNMKLAIVKETEREMFRPNLPARAQYYAVVALNQTMIERDESELANRLITVYFELFKLCVAREAMDSRLMSALLTGVNRAFPYSKLSDETFDKHMDTLFKVVHTAPFPTAVQALMLIFQVTTARKAVSDRFYRSLYELLLSPQLQHAYKNGVFLSLLYRAMRSDPQLDRVRAFAKRLLQLCFYQPASFVCAALYLLSAIIQEQPTLNQMAATAEPHGAAVDATSTAPAAGTEPATAASADHRAAVPGKKTAARAAHASSGAAMVAAPSAESDGADTPVYDPRKREPLHAHAGLSRFWELTSLAQHMHPSVQHFARQLLTGQPIVYAGNPLLDFATRTFLDRWVYRNPKKTARDRGGSAMQSHQFSFAELEAPVTAPEFVHRPSAAIRDEERFFHQYFVERARRLKAAQEKTDRKRKATEAEDDVASEVSDEEADALLRAFVEDEQGAADGFSDASASDGDSAADDSPADSDAFDYDDMPADDSDEAAEVDPRRMDAALRQSVLEADSDDGSADDESSDGSEGSDSGPGGARQRKRKGRHDEVEADLADDSVFASAEQFSHMLRGSGQPAKNKNQLRWEAGQRGGRGRGRGRGHAHRGRSGGGAARAGRGRPAKRHQPGK